MESKFFAEAISRRRLDAGLTQEALAQKAGINRTTYGSIERGQRTLSNENLVRLSIALGARIEEILAEAYRVHYVTLMEIEREVRRKLGVAPREGEERPDGEPHAVIESFVNSLKRLLLSFQPARREPAADFLTPTPTLGEGKGISVKRRRRARPSRPRQPKRR